MLKWLRNLLDDPSDPVKHCDLYKDKAAGSCAHVDGPLCDLPGCSMLKDYRERRSETYLQYLARCEREGKNTKPDACGGTTCGTCDGSHEVDELVGEWPDSEHRTKPCPACAPSLKEPK